MRLLTLNEPGGNDFSVQGLVDIHVHILPGLDDGARTRDNAIAMAATAKQYGTTRIVATPHVDPLCHISGFSDVKTIRRSVKELQECLDLHGISVQIMPGMEIAIAPNLAGHFDRGELMTVADKGKYVLIELPFQMIPSYAEEEIFNLAASGYTPIIAHPERNAAVIRNPNVLIPFIKAGALTHVNASSLLGQEGHHSQQTARILLSHSLAHIVASDGHSNTSRPCRLDQASEIASQLIGEDKAVKTVRDIPLAIVLGEDVLVDEPEEYRPPRKWWCFWEGNRSQ